MAVESCISFCSDVNVYSCTNRFLHSFADVKCSCSPKSSCFSTTDQSSTSAVCYVTLLAHSALSEFMWSGVCVQTLLSLGLSYGGCLSMVHMTMRSVKPSCLSVSAHTKAAGPADTKEEHNSENEKVKRRSCMMKWKTIMCWPEPMMRTWLKLVLELITAEHRAMGFDLFCDWRAWKCLKDLKSISQAVSLFSFINSPHSDRFLFLLPACLHGWWPCPFQLWPGANRHERCVHFLMVLRDMIRQKMC